MFFGFDDSVANVLYGFDCVFIFLFEFLGGAAHCDLDGVSVVGGVQVGNGHSADFCRRWFAFRLAPELHRALARGQLSQDEAKIEDLVLVQRQRGVGDRRVLQPIDQRVGLGQYFRAAITAREFGVGKPDPRIFHAAAGALDVRPQDVLHVGDDASLDVMGALNAGMQAAWVNRSDHLWPHDAQPHVVLTHLGELCELLK